MVPKGLSIIYIYITIYKSKLKRIYRLVVLVIYQFAMENCNF